MIRSFFILLLALNNNTLWAKEVNFITQDNAIIYANFFQRGPHAVLLAHGAVFNKDSWGEFEEKLLEENFTVLAIDFRGYNSSTMGDKGQVLYEDILAGVHFLNNQTNISKVTVLGASMGGEAAAKASVYSESDSIEQLILLSPAGVFEPEKLKGELLFIASREEYLAKTVQFSFKIAPFPKKLELLNGNAHGQNIFKTPQSQSLTTIILSFLKKGIPITE